MGNPSPLYDDPEVHAGFLMYCDLLEKHADRFNENLAQLYGASKTFAPLAAQLRGPAMAQRNAENVARLRKAGHEGDWEPYLANLRARGKAYAGSGVTFSDWSHVFQASLLFCIDLAHEDCGADHDRCRVLVKGMCCLFDTVVETIGQDFFAELQKLQLTQQKLIFELSTPVLDLGSRLLLVPLIGDVDDRRMNQMRERLLAEVRRCGARVVIIDLSGVAAVDTLVAGHLQRAAEAARLMGARVWLCGMSADVSHALVAVGVEFNGIDVCGGLDDAIARARVLLPIVRD